MRVRLLGGAGVEGRVDVDEVDARVGERAQGGEVFAVEDAVHGGFSLSYVRVWWKSAHAECPRGGSEVSQRELGLAGESGFL